MIKMIDRDRDDRHRERQRQRKCVLGIPLVF